MKQLKVESKSSQKILKVMQELIEQNKTKAKQNASKKFLEAITWHPDKQTLVATDAVMLIVWKVNDNNLLKVLSTAKKYVYFKYDNGMLSQVFKPESLAVLHYNEIIPRFNAHVRFEDLDIKVMKNEGITTMDVYLEYACICAQSRFNSVNFERASAIADYDVLEFIKGNSEKPVMLKSNSSRIVCVIMPLREDKIKVRLK